MRSVVTDGTGIGAAVPGREGGGQDRHGRAALDRQRGPDPRRPDPAAAGGGPHATPTRGSRPSRRSRTRRSRSACCSSARAPAAPPRRRPPRRCIEAALCTTPRRRGRRRPWCPLPPLEAELERAVLQRLGLDLEQQQRALDRCPRRRRSPAPGSGLGRDRVRLVGERVDVRVERDRPVDVVLRVHDLEVVGRGERARPSCSARA